MYRNYTIGVLRESKPGEMRVALTPDATAKLILAGGSVIIESGAGIQCGYSDEEYRSAGASISGSAETVLATADLILKVKEFLPKEIVLAKGKSLLAFLHPAGTPCAYTKALIAHGATAIAREHIVNTSGSGDRFPMLAPMSRIAGREAMLLGMRVQSETASVPTKFVVSVIGIGVAGRAAVTTALGDMYGGAISQVWMFDTEARVQQLRSFKRELADPYNRVHYSVTRRGIYSKYGIRALRCSDIIISSVMIPGGSRAPIVLNNEMLPLLKQGAFTIDIAIDQGGSFSWTNGNPTIPGELKTNGHITYAAAPNIPGSTSPAVAKEATDALTKATLPYLMAIIAGFRSVGEPKGAIYRALAEIPGLRMGLVTWDGYLVNRDIATALQLHQEYHSLEMFF